MQAEKMLTIMFDIKYYKNIRIQVISMQVLAQFVTSHPYFDSVFIIYILPCLFLIAICSHCL